MGVHGVELSSPLITCNIIIIVRSVRDIHHAHNCYILAKENQELNSSILVTQDNAAYEVVKISQQTSKNVTSVPSSVYEHVQ